MTSILVTFLHVTVIFVRFLPFFFVIVDKQGIKHVLEFRVCWWCFDELKQWCSVLGMKRNKFYYWYKDALFPPFFTLFCVFPFIECLIRLTFCCTTKVNLSEIWQKGVGVCMRRVKNVNGTLETNLMYVFLLSMIHASF